MKMNLFSKIDGKTRLCYKPSVGPNSCGKPSRGKTRQLHHYFSSATLLTLSEPGFSDHPQAEGG